MKNILVLGAGLVSAPFIRYFLRRRDYRLTILSQDLSRARQVVGSRSSATFHEIDVSDEAKLRPFFETADGVMNLVPASLFELLARLSIRHRVPMVSTSYVPAEVMALNGEAEREEVPIVGELGLDPGIDHLSATRMIRSLQQRGGTLTHFTSGCGGFPAQDANDNPWGYKFSWSPRAVVMAARQDARYLAGGKPEFVPGPNLFEHRWRWEVEDQGVLEMYPNRDSLRYVEPYGAAGVSNFFRGTLRYPGWSSTMHAAATLGLFDLEPQPFRQGTTYAELVTRCLPSGSGPLVDRLAGFLGVHPDSEVITRLEWAGFLSDRPIGALHAAPFDLFVGRLQQVMRYRPGERDMVAMQHEFTAEFPDGRTEFITSTLIRLGEAWGDSAMSQCVSLTAAIALRLILEGHYRRPGVQIPVRPDIAEPVLDELASYGIAMRDRVRTEYPTPFTKRTDPAERLR